MEINAIKETTSNTTICIISETARYCLFTLLVSAVILSGNKSLDLSLVNSQHFLHSSESTFLML